MARYIQDCYITNSYMGDSLTVKLAALTRAFPVQIRVPQPTNFKVSIYMSLVGLIFIFEGSDLVIYKSNKHMIFN